MALSSSKGREQGLASHMSACQQWALCLPDGTVGKSGDRGREGLGLGMKGRLANVMD